MPFVLALIMSLCLVACAPRVGVQGPKRSAAAAEQQMALLVSRSDRDIANILLSEMKVHEATVLNTSHDKAGKKITHVRWSHAYVTVSSRTVTTRKEVEAPSTAGVSVGGKPTLKYESKAESTDGAAKESKVKSEDADAKKQWREVSTTEYEQSSSTIPCDMFLTSDKGFIESLELKGEGCVW